MSKFKVALGLGFLFSLAILSTLVAQEEILPPTEIPLVEDSETPITLPEATPSKEVEVKPEEIGKMVGTFLGLAFGAFAILAIIGILCTVFWILMIIHAASKPIENKALWIIILVFTGVIGAIIYYFVVKRKFDLQEKERSQPPGVPPEAPVPPSGTV